MGLATYGERSESAHPHKRSSEQVGLALTVPRTRLLESTDINLSGDRYRTAAVRHTGKWPMVKLGKIAKVSAGDSAPQDLRWFSEGTVPFFRTSDVGAAPISADLRKTRDQLANSAVKELKLTVWPQTTILFPKSGASTFLNHRVMLGCSGVVPVISQP